MNEAPSSPAAASLPVAAQNSILPLEGAILQAGVPLLRGIISDAAGNPSSMRAAMLLAVGSVLVAWATISIQTHTLQPLPDSVVGLLGILVAGKFGQKFIEPDGKSLSTANPQNENASAQPINTLGALWVAPKLASAPFAVGDIVRLNSGGPDMAIKVLDSALKLACCAWDGQSGIFPLPCLTRISSATPLSSSANGVQGDPATGVFEAPHETKPGEGAAQ